MIFYAPKELKTYWVPIYLLWNLVSLVKLWWKVCFWQSGQPCGQLSSSHWAFGYVLAHGDASVMPVSDSDWGWHPVQVLVITERGGNAWDRDADWEKWELLSRNVSFPPHGMTLNFLKIEISKRSIMHWGKRGNVVCRTKLKLMGFLFVWWGEYMQSLF